MNRHSIISAKPSTTSSILRYTKQAWQILSFLSFPTNLSRSGRLAAWFLLGLLLLSVLLRLPLLGLHGREVDVPYEQALEDAQDQGRDEHEEHVGLVVKRRDGLGGRADAVQPGELALDGRAGVLWCRHVDVEALVVIV